MSNTPWNVYYLEYDVDEAMEIFTDYLLTPERTARFTIDLLRKEKVADMKCYTTNQSDRGYYVSGLL